MINRYSCAPELRGNAGGGISRIGPHCHEIGHALGAADYYDTDYDTGGSYPGTGMWDVMASGSWNDDGVSPANFNPYVKAFDFGWCEVTDVTGDMDLMLHPSSADDRVFRLPVGDGDECFLLENRQQEGFDVAVPGHGLLVYHVGDGIRQGVETNKVNASYPQCCYIVCASSEYRLPSSLAESYGQVNGGGCPFPGDGAKTEFGMATVPAALCTDGSWAGFSLAGICENGDGTVGLSVRVGDSMAEEEPVAEGDTVWSEPFDGIFIDSFWTQEVVEGGGRWETMASMSLMDFNRYLQLSPVSSPFEQEERAVVRLESSVLDLEPDDYVLSFKVACSSDGAKGVDDVTVSLYRDGVPLEGYDKKFEVYSEAWTVHSVAIDKNCLPLQFAITGTCYSSSILKLDDIVLRRRYSATAVGNVEAARRQGCTYGIGGMRLGRPENAVPGSIYIMGGKKYVAY